MIEAKVIEEWMFKLKSILDKERFHPSLIYNFDETFLFPGKRKVKVMVPSWVNRPALHSELEKGQHITLGVTICGDGSFPVPLLIFPLQYLPALPSPLPFHFYATGSTSGWINSEILCLWAEKILAEDLQEKRKRLGDPSAPALLVIDQHTTRQDEHFLGLLSQQHVQILPLPPHTSHILQPLDLSFFGCLKSQLKSTFNPLPDDGVAQKREKLIMATALAMHSATRLDHVMAGWLRSGIVPFDPSHPLGSNCVVNPDRELLKAVQKKPKRGPKIQGELVGIGKGPRRRKTQPEEREEGREKMKVDFLLN
eukprot:TRINITY_DN438_c0_g1_i2.p1 TRINITY_DN438_c0_g1~~TRINITY_DN438_c0_g1_i2.p1  ORF type:complete len:310 (+),score=62.06 TRINITY_DN438_c0_g1_i2:651-1580(+)